MYLYQVKVILVNKKIVYIIIKIGGQQRLYVYAHFCQSVVCLNHKISVFYIIKNNLTSISEHEYNTSQRYNIYLYCKNVFHLNRSKIM